MVTALRDHAATLGETGLVELLDRMFSDTIRNAFFHSDYILHGDEFRTREGRFQEGNLITQSIKVPKLIELINRGLAFYQSFMIVYRRHRLSYREPKVIKGRFGAKGEWVELTLDANPEVGLYGFHSP